MPLIKSGSRASIGTNIREMQAAGHSHAQSVAAALSNARKYGAHMASGGISPPMGERMAAKQLFHEGFLHGTGPGRVDHLPITVKGGAYVVPADHLSAIGQGNSTSGADIMHRMLKTGPYGSGATPTHNIRATVPHLNLNPKTPKLARGGHAQGVPIIAANGEFVISPEKVREIGGGDIDRGHKILDAWILATRKKHIKTLKGLRPPKKD